MQDVKDPDIRRVGISDRMILIFRDFFIISIDYAIFGMLSYFGMSIAFDFNKIYGLPPSLELRIVICSLVGGIKKKVTV